jgi:single-stranded DNA-binding protein
MLNQLILTGNLGNDPEIFFGSEGDPVTSFSLAFKSGREKTGWLNGGSDETRTRDLRRDRPAF